ncbi:DNA internalization-related competence protein ComEC/Rec2 [Lactobacillus jensenii]|uniref:DNA internalization-related competence protein ComEC/Rec2 n=1 Tax=Lactobacillus jensenii TaxID=109790 RepID=UPI002870760F|nr:DNA internalization-related competence protein ComEC/Rec2 [Lactobacillus jensenii]
MPALKINLNYSKKPGFYLLVAFLLISISFLFFEAKSYWHVGVIGIFCLFFSFLLIKKFKHTKLLLLVFIIIFSIRLFQSIPLYSYQGQVITIYPDQVKLIPDYVSGIGKFKNGKITLGFKPTSAIRNALSQGEKVLLFNIKYEVSEIEQAHNFGEINYRHYYASKGIKELVNIQNYQFISSSYSLIDFYHYLRFKLERYFTTFPRLLSFFAGELILGENINDDTQQILDNYRNLGVIHLLSISGLHVGIYTFVISVICYFFKITEDESFVIISFCLLLGILLCAGQAGFVRSCLTYFLGGLLKKKAFNLNNSDLLGLTAIVHLLINPRLFMNIGAILSYILVLGLKVIKSESSFKQGMLLNLLLTPLLLFNFYQVNIFTVFFNILIVPYFNFVVMPLTFINIFLFNKFLFISDIFEKILEFGEATINSFARTNIGMIIFGKITWWQVLFLLIVSFCYLIFRLESRKLKLSIVTLISAYSLIFISIHFPLQGQVTFIDVGQGDSILITTPFFRKSYLIDTGGKVSFASSKRPKRPQIEQITLPFLKAQGIDHLDGIFLSHQDADHVGDLGPLLDKIKVNKLYMARGLLKNQAFLKRIAGKVHKSQIKELLAGDRVNEGIKFDIVYPYQAGLGKNEDSLSVTFKVNNKRWLFTGDLDQAGEEVIGQKTPMKVNYFKLGHHGSKTSSSEHFLQIIQPDLVFISAGRNSRYHHPNQETLAKLDKLAIPYLSTQRYGSISYRYGFGRDHFETFLK